MKNQIRFIAGAVVLLTGTAQADTLKENTAQQSSAYVQSGAAVPMGRSAEIKAAQEKTAIEARQELSPDARPVYNNGGYFSGQDIAKVSPE